MAGTEKYCIFVQKFDLVHFQQPLTLSLQRNHFSIFKGDIKAKYKTKITVKGMRKKREIDGKEAAIVDK